MWICREDNTLSSTVIAALREHPRGCFIVDRGKEGERVPWKWKGSVGKCERRGKVHGVCISVIAASSATRKSKSSKWEGVKERIPPVLSWGQETPSFKMRIWKTNSVAKNGQKLARHKWHLINEHFFGSKWMKCLFHVYSLKRMLRFTSQGRCTLCRICRIWHHEMTPYYNNPFFLEDYCSLYFPNAICQVVSGCDCQAGVFLINGLLLKSSKSNWIAQFSHFQSALMEWSKIFFSHSLWVSIWLFLCLSSLNFLQV